jgi:hypothetical protein
MRRLFRALSSAQPPAHQAEPEASTPPPAMPLTWPLKPYDTPARSGRCWLTELPEQVLSSVLVKLDRVSLTRCYRVRNTTTWLISAL